MYFIIMPTPIPIKDQFSEQQKQEAELLFNSGATHDEIAKAFLVSRRTIMKLCKSLGLRRNHKEAQQNHKSDLDTPETIALIQSLRNTCSLREIAEKIQSSSSSVDRICNKYNIIITREEFQKSQSNRMIAAWTPEKREACKIKTREILQTRPEIIERIRKSSLDLWASPEYRLNQVRVQKEIWNSPERLKQLAEFRGNQQGKLSSLQAILYSILHDLGAVFYREHADGPSDSQCIIGPYNFDCVVPRENRTTLLIECQGDYWHSLERHIRLDQSKATYISNNFSAQYELKYLWEHEFKCFERVHETIKYWLGLTGVDIVDFEFDDISIKNCEAKDYKLLLSKYHYLANAGRGGLAFGAYLNNELVAVCVFSPLSRQNIQIDDIPKDNTRELSRLCIHPKYQKYNFASWFVSRCIKLLPTNTTCIVSYCDTTFNHHGAIYRALNFKEDKVVKPDYWYVNEAGWVMHKKRMYDHATKLEKTEVDYAESRGYKRVYGSEKLRFVFKRLAARTGRS
jgi:transposase